MNILDIQLTVRYYRHYLLTILKDLRTPDAREESTCKCAGDCRRTKYGALSNSQMASMSQRRLDERPKQKPLKFQRANGYR